MDILPNYEHRNEKPATYDADPGNYARQVYNLKLRDSLICFLQQKLIKDDQEYFSKTVVF